MKNPCGKTVDRAHAYEIWRNTHRIHVGGAIFEPGTWTWYVLKKWQIDDNQDYARWFCDVVTPMCPEGETGDVYVKDITRHAAKVGGTLMDDKPSVDLGWENGWDETPDVVKECRKLGHALTETDEGSRKNRGLDTVTRCLLCRYKFHTDSSD